MCVCVCVCVCTRARACVRVSACMFVGGGGEGVRVGACLRVYVARASSNLPSSFDVGCLPQLSIPVVVVSQDVRPVTRTLSASRRYMMSVVSTAGPCSKLVRHIYTSQAFV